MDNTIQEQLKVIIQQAYENAPAVKRTSAYLPFSGTTLRPPCR